jgi:hypothetical protein
MLAAIPRSKAAFPSPLTAAGGLAIAIDDLGLNPEGQGQRDSEDLRKHQVWVKSPRLDVAGGIAEQRVKRGLVFGGGCGGPCRIQG